MPYYNDETYVDCLNYYTSVVDSNTIKINWEKVFLKTLINNLHLKINAIAPRTSDVRCMLASNDLPMIRIHVYSTNGSSRASNKSYLYGDICTAIQYQGFHIKAYTYTKYLGWSFLCESKLGNFPVEMENFNFELYDISGHSTTEFTILNQTAIDNLKFMEVQISHILSLHGLGKTS